MCGSDIFLGLIAVLFPPLAVWVKRGICSADSLINIALCMLGFLPGLFHAWYIIAVSPDPTYEQVNDEEQGNVTYYYVQGQPQYAPGGGQRTHQQGYGTVNNAPKNNTPNAQFPGQQNGFVGGGPSAPTPAESSRPSTDVPPSYAQAVQGDHKVQTS